MSPEDNYKDDHGHAIRVQSARLRLAMIESNIDKKQLSEKISVTLGSVDKWLSGKSKIPLDRHAVIATALGRHRHYLVDGESDKYSQDTRRNSDIILSLYETMTQDQREHWIIDGHRLINNFTPDQTDDDVK